MHAVLLGEDEGDNALRQRGLRASVVSKQNEQSVSRQNRGNKRKARRRFRQRSCWLCLPPACKVQKRKGGCAALFRHRGHIDQSACACPAGHLTDGSLFANSFLFFFNFKRRPLSVASMPAACCLLPKVCLCCAVGWLVGWS